MKTQPKMLLRGGVTPPAFPFSAPAASGIANAAIPGFALIPMLQHAGPPARCLVKAGDRVQEGMLIGRADGSASANVHSSIPGTVLEVRNARGADGRISAAVLIEFGGEFAATGRRRDRADWEKLSRADLLARIQSAGVVGLGGGLVPTHVKLARPAGSRVDLFIANGMDSEPSLVGDAALLREKAGEISIGIRICRPSWTPPGLSWPWRTRSRTTLHRRSAPFLKRKEADARSASSRPAIRRDMNSFSKRP